MEYHLTLAPDITIKSSSVRRHLARCLATNVRNALRRRESRTKVIVHWDHLTVRLPDDLDASHQSRLEQCLADTPGIHRLALVRNIDLVDFHAIATHITTLWAERIAGRRFRVSVQRSGQHDFSSTDLERHLGAALLAASPTARVELSAPDVDVRLRIQDRRLSLEERRHDGLGGYPIGTQGQAMVLMSGGYDSPVAAWKMLRRGVKCQFLLFRLGGGAQHQAVHEVTHTLWERYGASHRVGFTCVPFEKVVDAIHRVVPEGLMGVVLKRMMARSAALIAQRARIPALVTGDAIAQVSSQTLTNLASIDAASHLPILRPLLTDDKQDIIDLARRIGTAPLSAAMPEYCGVISHNPHVKAKRADIEAAESRLPPGLIDDAVAGAHRHPVDRHPVDRHPVDRHPVDRHPEDTAPPDGSEAPVRVVRLDIARTLADARVIDIRQPEAADAAPLAIDGLHVERLPFYDVATRPERFADDYLWLLYCDQGLMSRMQADALRQRGVRRVAVLELG